MEQSNLKAEVQLVHDRVLSRPPEQVLEQATVGSQTVWTFTPIVELLMLDAVADLRVDLFDLILKHPAHQVRDMDGMIHRSAAA